MAALKIFQFPAEWNGAVKCDSSAYQPATKIVPELVRCTNCGFDCDGKTRQVNGCHTRCSVCQNCGCARYLIFRPLPTKPDDIPPAGIQFHPFRVEYDLKPAMEAVVASHVNVAVTNAQADMIMSDLTRKLSGYDPNNGLGLFHGYLVNSDDTDLLVKLLELGVDTELRFIFIPGGNAKLDEDGYGNVLNGGTAVHFAVRFGRAKCFQALVDAGAKLDDLTAAGEDVTKLKGGCVMKEVVVSIHV